MSFDFNIHLPKSLPSGDEVSLSPYEWCKHHFQLVFVKTTKNGSRYRLRCPMCLLPEKPGQSGVGKERAISEMGQIRVQNALEIDRFRDEPEKISVIRWVVRRIRYQEYLLSPEWQEIRSQALEASGGKCERCGANADHVHHKTYENFGNENLHELEALCVPCHHAEHGRVF